MDKKRKSRVEKKEEVASIKSRYLVKEETTTHTTINLFRTRFGGRMHTPEGFPPSPSTPFTRDGWTVTSINLESIQDKKVMVFPRLEILQS